jgi:hypothetical protein
MDLTIPFLDEEINEYKRIIEKLKNINGFSYELIRKIKILGIQSYEDLIEKCETDKRLRLRRMEFLYREMNKGKNIPSLQKEIDECVHSKILCL